MTSIPPGWYPDQQGVTRWWDGTQWTAATQPAPSPYPAQPQYPAHAQYPSYPQGVYAQPEAYPQVAPGTSGTTIWAWLLAFLPLVTLIMSIAYASALGGVFGHLSSELSQLSSGSPGDTTRMTADIDAAIFNGWYFAVLGVGLLTFAATIVFAYLDHRELAGRGFVNPFHWAWAFVPTYLVYMIGRTVVVHRRGGKSLGPLWAMIGVTVGSWIVGSIVSTTIVAQLLHVMSTVMSSIGTGGY
ncbi:MAG TPA: DUF2510 domain-containing protein [Microbacterium sp.]|nr:DUF2510 domain-containing protein [Microbacterium sp.]